MAELPLGRAKRITWYYPVYIDELAEVCDVISVSAGIRGLQILLAPADYIRAVKATVAAIAKAR